jgi:hypothetical protein
VVPLIGTLLLSAVGQLGIKFALEAGKKLFGGKEGADASAESFPAQLKDQMEKASTPTPAVSGPLALAQLPPGLQAPRAAPGAEAALPITSAADIYRRFEATWPGRSESTSVISPLQAP